MELTDIIALVKAGYTRDEISRMEQTPTPVTNPEPVQMQMDIPTQTPEPTPAPAQVAEPVAVAAPAPVQTPAQAEPTMAELMQSIAKLTSAVQANAIAQSVIPSGLSDPPHAEDMLAEIIRPTFHQRGD